RRQPESALLLSTSALIHSALGQSDEASRLYRAATQLDRRWPSVVHRQAWRWSTHPDERERFPELAVWLARKLTDAFPQQAEAFDAQAAAQAAAGDFDAAAASAAKAVELASGSAQDAGKFRERLELYKRRQPFREPP